MARRCKLTGVGPMVGNKVSHAQNHTKRRWLPNIQDQRIFVPELNRWVRVKMTTRALRTVNKKGLMNFLRDEGLSLNDVI